MMTQDQSQEIWNLIRHIEVPMLTTCSGDLVRARPMYQVQEKFHGTIWFLTSEDSAKADEINDNEQVCLAYADPQKGIFVSMSGSAGFVKDKTLIEKFLNPAATAWIAGNGSSQDLTLLEIHVEKAEAWDAETNAMKRLFESVRSQVTDSVSDHGAHQKYG